MLKKIGAVKSLLIINVAMFFISSICALFGIEEIRYLYGWNFLSDNFQLHQLITYQFIHNGILHILFNMLVLYSIGPFVEEYLGRNKFYLFYIISGVFSAFTHMLFTNNIEIPLVGASGSIWGIIVMFAFIHKNHELNFMFIPINIKAKYLIPIMFLIELACCVFYSIDNVSHLAHVGGAIMGFILILIDKRYHVSN